MATITKHVSPSVRQFIAEQFRNHTIEEQIKLDIAMGRFFQRVEQVECPDCLGFESWDSQDECLTCAGEGQIDDPDAVDEMAYPEGEE